MNQWTMNIYHESGTSGLGIHHESKINRLGNKNQCTMEHGLTHNECSTKHEVNGIGMHNGTRPNGPKMKHETWNNECTNNLNQWTMTFEWNMPFMRTLNVLRIMSQWTMKHGAIDWMHHRPRINGLEWKLECNMTWMKAWTMPWIRWIIKHVSM